MPLPLARSIQADLDPLPMERVESSARTGDETYSPNGGKSGRGSEDNASKDDLEDFDEQAADVIASQSAESNAISFFA
jgi:hypothetical protein